MQGKGKRFKMGFLLCGNFTDAVTKVHGDYGVLYRNFFDRCNHNMSFENYWVQDGQIPQSPQECDAWLISGSRHACYEDLLWIKKLVVFISACTKDKVPMIGICFGHQIMAHALGGEVALCDKGWGLGRHSYQTSLLESDMSLNAVHKDQVIKIPDQSICVGHSSFCKYGALWYPGFGLSIQLHPEFTNAFLGDLIKARRGIAFPEKLADTVTNELRSAQQYHMDEVATLLSQFVLNPQALTLAAIQG